MNKAKQSIETKYVIVHKYKSGSICQSCQTNPSEYMIFIHERDVFQRYGEEVYESELVELCSVCFTILDISLSNNLNRVVSLQSTPYYSIFKKHDTNTIRSFVGK